MMWKRAVICMLLAAFLGGCTKGQKEEQKTEIRMGISLYRGDDTFINNIRSVLETKAKDYEREHGIKVILDIQDAKGSQNTQNNQLNAISQSAVFLQALCSGFLVITKCPV